MSKFAPTVKSKPTPKPETPKPVDRHEAIKLKLFEVKAYYEGFAGKRGMNPFFYLSREVYPLQVRFELGDSSEELYNKVMALKCEEPKVV